MKKNLKRVALGIVTIFAIIILYLLLWPVNINPAAWTPPEAPALTGVYAENDHLSRVEKLAEGYYDPEAIAIGNDGYLYTGLLSDGRILRISPDGETIEVFAQAHLPAGMKFDAEGNLIVAEGNFGLTSIDIAGNVTTLTNEIEGIPINFADDLVIASDGKIYFSDASVKYSHAEFLADLFEHRPNGRLLVFDPLTGVTSVLLEVHDIVFDLPNDMGKGAAIWEPLRWGAVVVDQDGNTLPTIQIFEELRDKYLK
ncbi:MAG: hypothetical protein K0B09_08760 [Bacteroidales bacterium]|nr:hypothetical protein [Bacteroidales bacterium]